MPPKWGYLKIIMGKVCNVYSCVLYKFPTPCAKAAATHSRPWHCTISDAPDLRRILGDGAVAGEVAGTCGVQQTLLGEGHLVAVGAVGGQLGIHIGRQIQQQVVLVGPVPGRALQ